MPFRMPILLWLTVLIGASNNMAVSAEPLVLTPELHHLRVGESREWSEFPEEAEGSEWSQQFDLPPDARFQTLRLRQQDVKQYWKVRLNGRELGRLERDENDMVIYFPIPAGVLKPTGNRLVIEGPARPRGSDDIRVGELALLPPPREEVLGESRVRIVVTGPDGESLPARVTVVDEQGTLQSVGATSNERYAVRPGTVYTGDGIADFGLPAGRYTIYAGRGFEYSLATEKVEMNSGERRDVSLKIRREVPTEGYVACDTHVHTLTHSGHGDATVQERMITLAAEGIELPVATDHNVHVDHRPFAKQMGVSKYFTPVIGNEVTTPVAHFNCFPIAADAPIPAHRLDDFNEIYDGIYGTRGVRAVILNHARDVHSGVTPFGPQLHLAAAGVPLPDEQGRPRPMRANAMEVLNSGATQTDAMQLLRDWMGLLNHGYHVTPVGSSDSHDVARHFVGQGRTYIRCDDSDPSKINVLRASNQFVRGAVMVSYGLAAEMKIDGKYESGDRASPSGPTVLVGVRVLGPHWVRASTVELYANGQLIKSERIEADATRPELGVIWQGEWELDVPSQDVVYAAVARGPGETQSFWRAAKPYQPTSPQWTPTFLGCSGAVWLDADRDGKWQSAYDYAKELSITAGKDFSEAIGQLDKYDDAVAIQFAHLDYARTGRILTPAVKSELDEATPRVREALQQYARSLRNSVQAGGVIAPH